jgi:hypothetical protein
MACTLNSSRQRGRFAAVWAVALTFMVGVAPVLAEQDLSGNWAARNHEDNEDKGPGPPLVQYWGLPLNDAARDRALAYEASILSVPERQCLLYAPQYRIFGPSNMKVWATYDPVTGKPLAWHMSAFLDMPQLTIWMDGRPEPGPGALHSFAGFMRGEWQGDTLVVHVDHIKEAYFRRNGVPSSDRTTITWFLSRHGDLLSFSEIMQDPVYLTEPLALSKIFKEVPTLLLSTTTTPCVPADELPELQSHEIPQYLPGRNPNLNGMLERYNVPTAAALGGAPTMYPEYQQVLVRDGYKPPTQYCGSYCCGWGGPQKDSAGLLKCRID